jgi:hypothetical protein
VRDNFTYLYGYALRYIQKKIELGCKALPSTDKSLERERGPDKNLKIHLTNTFDALDILDHINQSTSKIKVIETYDVKLS